MISLAVYLSELGVQRAEGGPQPQAGDAARGRASTGGSWWRGHCWGGHSTQGGAGASAKGASFTFLGPGRVPWGEGWLEKWVYLNLREQFCQSKGK